MFKVSKGLYQSSRHDEIFAGGNTTPQVVKILNKQPWVKIENLRIFDHNLALFRGKI